MSIPVHTDGSSPSPFAFLAAFAFAFASLSSGRGIFFEPLNSTPTRRSQFSPRALTRRKTIRNDNKSIQQIHHTHAIRRMISTARLTWTPAKRQLLTDFATADLSDYENPSTERPWDAEIRPRVPTARARWDFHARFSFATQLLFQRLSKSGIADIFDL